LEFMQLLQDMIGDLEGAPTPIEVKVFGDDPERLASLAETVETRLKEVRGVVDVVGMQRGNPEVTWEVDPAAAGRLGVSVAQMGEQLHAALLGDVATELRLFDRSVPVRVRYPDALRFDPDGLARTLVRGTDGHQATVASLARPSPSGPQWLLLRENLRP